MTQPSATAPYTLVVTSCGRFDLLVRTLTSFFAEVDEPPARAVLVEDSTDLAVVEAVRGFPIEAIVNRERLGQMRSIDNAYALVDTPLIFHCEDDWLFTGGGFIARSRRLLEAMPEVSMVGLRDRSTLNPLLRRLPDVEAHGERFFLTDPAAHPDYFSYSFNPGLRRTADARAIGPFAALGHEADVSYAFKKAGFRMAYLSDPVVAHIGEDRHVDDPRGPKRPTNPVERLARSFEKRLKRVRRALGGG